MFVVHVHVHVKKDRVDDFISASRENAANSLQEPGVVRFDIVQQEENPDFFILEEAYKTQADSGSHKDTPHYKKWKNVVEDMMAEPRRTIRFRNIFPSDTDLRK
jgi:(4S)-4-hydroxy-5-phosphonooxypentane-2,3-dione isomerase